MKSLFINNALLLVTGKAVACVLHLRYTSVIPTERKTLKGERELFPSRPDCSSINHTFYFSINYSLVAASTESYISKYLIGTINRSNQRIAFPTYTEANQHLGIMSDSHLPCPFLSTVAFGCLPVIVPRIYKTHVKMACVSPPIFFFFW